MKDHFLPPSEKIQELEPYLLVTTAVIVLVGILGGWAGENWLWVASICAVRLGINFGSAVFRKSPGRYAAMIALVAIINYLSTLAILLLVDKSPNPFWLLFMVETIAASMYRALYGMLIYSASAYALLGTIIFTQGLDRPAVFTGLGSITLALFLGLITYRGLELMYGEQEIRERVEIKVHQSEQRLRQITDNMIDLITQIDSAGNIYYASPSYQTSLGYLPEALQGRNIFDYVHPEDVEAAIQVAEGAFAAVVSVKLEVRLRHADGRYLWFECIGNPSYEGDRLVGGIVSGRDITERRQMEENTRASLREKEVLLKEIHHRVKNNLQVISSLLSLQSQKIQNPDSLDAFRESRDRVRSMALIHEKLYQSENLAQVEFGQYIQNLAASLFRSYRTNSANIQIHIQCDQIYLDIDTSVPCGLILNELISNAIKHAFSENQPGEIWIEMRISETNQVTLTVRDNGVGLPPDLDPHSTPSLGMQLVNTLIDQIGGELRFQNNHGAQIEIAFQNHCRGLKRE